MKNLFRKLGVQVVALVIVMLAAALLTVNIISLAILRSFTDDILTSKAVVGRQVPEETLKEEIATLEHTRHTLTENRGFIRAVHERDKAVLDRDYFPLVGQSDDYFMVVSDYDGNIVYRSDSYPFDTYDFGGTYIQIYLNSVVQRSGKLAVMAADSVNAEGEELVLAIGFKLSEGKWLQADMLLADFPDNGTVSLHAAMTPAREVGGDFYDFFFIDKDHLALVMADVSGKGVPAALLCVVTKVVLRNQVMTGGSPAEILGRVNRTVAAYSGGLFVTVWLGILDLKTGVVYYCNAGHEYPVVCRKNSDVEIIKTDSYPPVAAMDDMEYGNETLKLEKGDSLFLYTDGVPEAKSSVGTRFGMDRLIKVLERNKNKSPVQIVTALKRRVDDFQPENEPFDDVTLMSVLWKGQ